MTGLTFTSLGQGADDFDYQFVLDNLDVTVSAVPEPATRAMTIVGFGAAGAMVRAGRSGRAAGRARTAGLAEGPRASPR